MKRVNFQNTIHACTAGFLEQSPTDGIPEIVLAGRSNIGKSSLINALTGSKHARVSQTPGKTRLVLYFLVDDLFYLTDLPGYGYAKGSHEAITKFNQLADDYFAADRPVELVLMLIDIRHGPTESDQVMMNWLHSQQLPYFLIMNKADKLSKAQISKQIRELDQKGLLPLDVPKFVVSTSKKLGIKELQNAIAAYIQEMQ